MTNYKRAPTILLISATSGFGHVRAGESLAAKLREVLPGWSVRHETLENFSSSPMRWFTERGWRFCSEVGVLRGVYSIIHRIVTSSDRAANILNSLFDGVARRLDREFAADDVRMVIALHPGAALAAARWKAERSFRLVVVATDLVVHSLQVVDEIDDIYADPTSLFLSPKAIKARDTGKIRFCGLPIEQRFFSNEFIHRRIGSGTILVSFGAAGVRGTANVNRLIKLIYENDLETFTVICGKNAKFRRDIRTALREAGLEARVEVFGFVEDMERHLANSEVLIGKPGGLTIGEALASGVPIGVMDYLPGQEEANLEVLCRRRQATMINSAKDLSAFLTTVRASRLLESISRSTRASAFGIEAMSEHIKASVIIDDFSVFIDRIS